MGELIGQPASRAGIDGVVAEKTVGIMLGFVRSEGRSDKIEALIDRLPGAEAAIAAASAGGLGRLMAVGTGVMGLGPGMEIQSIASELLRVSLDKTGAERMGEIIAGTPGLGQFA